MIDKVIDHLEIEMSFMLFQICCFFSLKILTDAIDFIIFDLRATINNKRDYSFSANHDIFQSVQIHCIRRLVIGISHVGYFHSTFIIFCPFWSLTDMDCCYMEGLHEDDSALKIKAYRFKKT